MKTSSVNPLNLDYAGTEEWAESYVQEELNNGHILRSPAPMLLTNIYAQMVVEGSIVANEWVKRACQRHLKDLEKSKDPKYPWKFDEAKGWRPIRFIEKRCKPSKGDFRHLILQPWQHFIVGNMFGWVNKKTGYRRFRESLIFLGRKNGKTTLESGLADYMAGFDGENGPNCYVLANSQKQASILYEEARAMINSSPWLKERYVPNRSEIRYPAKNGKIEALSAEKNNKDGENLHFGVFDEIHEYQDYTLINVMKRSRGTRKQPLIVYITTAGSILDGPLVDYIEQGQDCLKNYADNVNERTFYYMASLDDAKEADDPRMWVKANPNLGLMAITDLINDYKTDRRSPRELADWITKQFNIFADTDELSFITPETLALNNKHVDLADLDGAECIGGYDLSDTEDFTSACLEFPLDDGGVFVLEKSWIPQKRYERDKNPERIKEWESRGEIEIIPGDYVDYSYVLDWFLDMNDKYDILKINYDPAKALRLNKELEQAGFDTEIVRQGFYTLGGPMQNIKELLLDGKVAFNEQKIFKWYLNNIKLRQDRNDNWMPDKQSQSRKIDGFAAFLDAHVSCIDMLVEPDDGGPSSTFVSFK
ncbi:terminase large subunit [Ligilactobacillus pobuzihii]|uniref:terminase large subunit n=1 Tax=Ligilactobacillus pobuzihii TaxID=449659 RepID=UPI0019D0A624|nr:terminase large subunit [Ligilactobacillus pobuzihii]MBN7275515.1 terminase large subunit [Ligilactobacillus pobuzihii]